MRSIKEMDKRLDEREKEIERLEKRNKEIYEGFMATTEELCEATKEIEKLKQENNFLKQIIGNNEKYSYGIRTGSDKE